ncbi:MAG: hypothetical protein IJI50_03515 [Ruminococcus sp.]|nr:hypothetical protein [Ruminococcus sp.]
MELKEMMKQYQSTKDAAPVAEGIRCASMKGMLDCNDVDGNCSTND